MLTSNQLFSKLENELPIIEKIDNDHDKLFFTHLNLNSIREMHAYSVDERVYEFLAFSASKDISDTKNYLEKLISRTLAKGNDNRAMYWFIRREKDNQLIGTAGLLNLSFNNQSVEWGFGIDPNYWGKGYILQVLLSLQNYVFRVLKLNRLYGSTFIKNERTIQTLKALGMKQEGILREFTKKNNIYVDGWKYSILKNDYEDLVKKTLLTKTISKKRNLNQVKIEKDVILIISDILRDDNISIDSDMENSDNWDSLNHMAIIVRIHEKLGIDFTPKEISKATSVRKIISMIK